MNLLETETRQGIDKLLVMQHIITITDSDEKNIHKDIAAFKALLEGHIKRTMSIEEDRDLYAGLLRYIKSDGGDPDRFAAVNYLVELDFLKP